MSDKFNAEELFNNWANNVAKEYQYGRFLFNNRAEILESLFEAFMSNDIDIDEVRVYKNRALSILVTKEGAKGQGKYKGWKETVSKDFDSMLVDIYEAKTAEKKIDPAEQESRAEYKKETLLDIIKQPIPKQPLIEVWGKVTYNGMWNEALSIEAHTFGTPIFNNFFYSVMKADWISNPDIMPAWAKGVLLGND